ncbi:MAG: hypothetical protein ABIQ61_13385 [Ornithinibacter sp.]
MTKTRTRIAATLAAAAGVAAIAASPAQAAPDTSCMKAGISTLKSAGLLQSVAKDGITVGTAVSVGVGVREGNAVPALNTVISYSALLADHRAGANSYFTYPWCS